MSEDVPAEEGLISCSIASAPVKTSIDFTNIVFWPLLIPRFLNNSNILPLLPAEIKALMILVLLSRNDELELLIGGLLFAISFGVLSLTTTGAR